MEFCGGGGGGGGGVGGGAVLKRVQTGESDHNTSGTKGAWTAKCLLKCI